ncbi:MAG: hypothetical protein WCZ89_09975 [Phycisphaerae bacterium]
MRNEPKNSRMPGRGLIGQFYAQKKKSFVALSLVAIMIFMWIRLLRSQSPKTAAGSVVTSGAASASKDASDTRIKFITLPSIAGRHDVLHRDFFQMDAGIFSGAKPNIMSFGPAGETVVRIARMLKLDAISMGAEPQAFINDRLLKAGQKIIVREGDKQYECEVTDIQPNVVTVKIEDTEVELKLKENQDFSEQ